MLGTDQAVLWLRAARAVRMHGGTADSETTKRLLGVKAVGKTFVGLAMYGRWCRNIVEILMNTGQLYRAKVATTESRWNPCTMMPHIWGAPLLRGGKQ
eukprot:scaffold236539_cov33-Tisochrysis_lutea.AAC.5